ncbi:sensor histidine kinase [Chloroflexi bacterium TSY]|nr:sensor histidine kinase [Chloroflexi bacterium TSY]
MRSQARFDLLIILAVALLAAIAELFLGFVDPFAAWMISLEHLLLTEIFTLLLIGAVGFAIYSWRRWREVVAAQRDNQKLRQSVVRAEGLNQRYRNYAEAVTHGQEEERMRLARELHDDTIHRLILLNQQVELVRFDHGKSPVATDLDRMHTILTDTIDHIRRFIQDLRPTYLDELGLIPALRILAQEKKERTGIDIQFSVEGEEERLPAATELTLYRIAQTALRNVILHAKANKARMQLGFEKNRAHLYIRDDGQGFEVPDLTNLSQNGNFGLMGMSERAALHGGTFTIESNSQKGTIVSVVIPSAQ